MHLRAIRHLFSSLFNVFNVFTQGEVNMQENKIFFFIKKCNSYLCLIGKNSPQE